MEVSTSFKPTEHEAERASNSYLVSLVAAFAGLPIPVINLIATVAFYFSNQKATFFVRWHCTQALLSQFALFIMNSFSFWWTISIIFGNLSLSNNYFAYMIMVVLFNFIEIIATIYTCMQIRKGVHVKWWFFGKLTDIICKSEKYSKHQLSTFNNK